MKTKVTIIYTLNGSEIGYLEHLFDLSKKSEIIRLNNILMDNNLHSQKPIEVGSNLTYFCQR